VTASLVVVLAGAIATGFFADTASAATPPPPPTILTGPAGLTASTSATFTFKDSQAGVSFKCSLDSGTFSTCTSGVTYNSLAQGIHNFSVEAVSGGSTSAATASPHWTVDTTPPSVTVAFLASGGFYNATSWTGAVTGTATDSSGVASVAVGVLQQATGKYWNGSSAFSSSTLVLAPASGTTSWSYPLVRPTDGAYTIDVRATDALGNATAASNLVVGSFTIDTVRPAAPFIVGGPGNVSTDINPEFSFTDASYPNVSFSCQLDSGAVVACNGDTDNDGDPTVQGEWQYQNLVPGTHCFSVWATDRANNVSPVTLSCWTILGIPAAIAVVSGSGQSATVHSAFGAPLVAKVTDSHGNPVSGAVVTFTAPSSGASGTFAPCSGGNNASFTTCVVTTSASGLAASSVFTANTAGGPYAVTAAVGSVSTKANFSLTNTVGVATAITAYSGSGQSTTVHSAFGSPLAAKVTDGYGNPVPGVTVTFAVPSTGASASITGGNTAVTNASGIATSGTVTANTIAGSCSVTASASGVGSVGFSLTNVPGPATAIIVVSGSGQSTTVHSSFGAPVVAKVTDTYGNPVPGATVTFTPPSTGASATITGGNTAVTNASGVAISGTLTANTTSGSYQVTASAAGAGSTTFGLTNTVGAASKLVFTTQPSSGQNITAGSPITVKVAVADTYGNIETGDTSTQVSLALGVNPGGSTLACTNAGGTGPVTVSGGAASLACSLTKSGTGYTLVASSNPAHGTTTSNAFNIVAAKASQLVFSTQPPASTPASSTFATTVTIEDPYGNVAVGDSATVALSLSINPCSGTLGGTASRAASNGVATFTGLQITKACTGYVLKATDTADGPLTQTSNPFAITAAAVSQLVFTTQPPASTPPSSTFTVAVSIEDLYGNVVTGDTHTVSLSLSANPCSGTLGGTTAQTAVAGVATFTNVQVTTVCTGYKLSATDMADGPLLSTSTSFAITGATASAIAPSPGTPQFTSLSTAFGSPLVAKVTDSHGNPVPGVQVTFTAPGSGASGTFASCSGGNNATFTTCVVTTNASGLATASTFTANGTSGAYSVTATTPGVGTPATFSLINSANFTISGDIVPLLYPGTSQPLNLVFTNPNPSPITIASGAVTITITTTTAGCVASTNFAVIQGLTASVTVPANSTRSLSSLSTPQANWPVISMVETHTNQDACEGAPLTLHYSGGATG